MRAYLDSFTFWYEATGGHGDATHKSGCRDVYMCDKLGDVHLPDPVEQGVETRAMQSKVGGRVAP